MGIHDVQALAGFSSDKNFHFGKERWKMATPHATRLRGSSELEPSEKEMFRFETTLLYHRRRL